MDWKEVEVDDVDYILSCCITKKKTNEVSLGREHKGKTIYIYI